MTDAPKAITIVRAIGDREWRLKAPLETMSLGLAGYAEYVRVVPAEEDAADDARIAAASRREWAERAWAAEAERDRLREALVNETAKRICLERGFDLYSPTQDVYCEGDPDIIYPWAGFRHVARAALKGETAEK